MHFQRVKNQTHHLIRVQHDKSKTYNNNWQYKKTILLFKKLELRFEPTTDPQQPKTQTDNFQWRLSLFKLYIDCKCTYNFNNIIKTMFMVKLANGCVWNRLNSPQLFHGVICDFFCRIAQ